MTDEIQDRLGRKVFVPFTIVSSSGEKYRVPSRDHFGFSPHKSRVLVWSDRDTTALIATLHIVAIEDDTLAEQPAQPSSSAS